MFKYIIIIGLVCSIQAIVFAEEIKQLSLSNTIHEVKKAQYDNCKITSSLYQNIEQHISKSIQNTDDKLILLHAKAEFIGCHKGYDNPEAQRTLLEIVGFPIEQITNKALYAHSVFHYYDAVNYQDGARGCDVYKDIDKKMTERWEGDTHLVKLLLVDFCSQLPSLEKFKQYMKLKKTYANDRLFKEHLSQSLSDFYYSINQWGLGVEEIEAELDYIYAPIKLTYSYYDISLNLIQSGELNEADFYINKFEASVEELKDNLRYEELFGYMLYVKTIVEYKKQNFDQVYSLSKQLEALPNFGRTISPRHLSNVLILQGIACAELDNTPCIKLYLTQLGDISQHEDIYLPEYLADFYIKYYGYLNNTKLVNKAFNNYKQELMDKELARKNAEIFSWLLEEQNKQADLKVSLVNEKLKNSRSLIVFSLIVIALLTFVTYIIWHQKNRQKLLAEIDELTRVFNRRATFQHIEMLAKPTRNKLHAIALFDLDRFKSINDTYSHLVGDRALRHIVGITKQCIRQQDIFGRIGGEEFMLVLKNISKEKAEEVIEKIRCLFEQTPLKLSDGKVIEITASFSLGFYKTSLTNFDIAYQQLDEGLYQAKQKGRNKIVVV